MVTEPADRPMNLERISDPRIKKDELPPVDVDKDGRDGILDWCETLRDRFQSQGELLTVRGLIMIARMLGSETAPAVIRNIKEIYADEYKTEANQKQESPVVTEEPKKAKPKPTNGKVKPTISNVKVVAGKKVKIDASPVDNKPDGQVSKKSKAPLDKGSKIAIKYAKAASKVVKDAVKDLKKSNPDKKDKPAKVKKVTEPKGELIKLKNKTDLQVTLRKSPTGQSRPEIEGHGLRPLLRFIATLKTCKTKEACAEYAKMVKEFLIKTGLAAEGVNCVGEKMSLDSVINDHLASGRKGEDSWHGPPANVDAKLAKRLKALIG